MKENIKYCDISILEKKSFFFDHVHIVWNEQINFHQHDTWEISYVITGSGTRIIGNEVQTFSSGEIIFIPPNIPHCWSFDEFDHDNEGKIENITIIFQTVLFDKVISLFPETKTIISKMLSIRNAVGFSKISLSQLQSIMMDMITQNDIERLASILRIFNIIALTKEIQCVGELVVQNKNTKRMQEINRYILNNYQRTITLDEVARFIGMNKSAFCSFFKQENKKSFFTVLNEYRVECACLMLRETKISISIIGFTVGFEDIPHYNRTFKKKVGMTPKEYRIKQLTI